MITAFPHRLGVSQAVKKEFSNIVTMWVVVLLLLLLMPIALIAAACHATALREHCGAGATRPSAGAPYCTPWSVGTSVQVTPSPPWATVCLLCQHRPMRVIQASVCAWARSSCTPSPSSFSPLYPCNPSSRSVFTSFAFRSHTRAMPPIKTQKSHSK
jgi:hypothetical protein